MLPHASQDAFETCDAFQACLFIGHRATNDLTKGKRVPLLYPTAADELLWHSVVFRINEQCHLSNCLSAIQETPSQFLELCTGFACRSS
jgi:hypothetical protein